MLPENDRHIWIISAWLLSRHMSWFHLARQSQVNKIFWAGDSIWVKSDSKFMHLSSMWSDDNKFKDLGESFDRRNRGAEKPPRGERCSEWKYFRVICKLIRGGKESTSETSESLNEKLEINKIIQIWSRCGFVAGIQMRPKAARSEDIRLDIFIRKRSTLRESTNKFRLKLGFNTSEVAH